MLLYTPKVPRSSLGCPTVAAIRQVEMPVHKPNSGGTQNQDDPPSYSSYQPSVKDAGVQEGTWACHPAVLKGYFLIWKRTILNNGLLHTGGEELLTFEWL